MFNRPLLQTPEPTIQQLPVQNVVGGLAKQPYIIVKHNISQSIKSVHVTCDNDVVVFGAMRKIFFRKIDSFERTRKLLDESKISFLGSKANTIGQVEVQQIECHPRLPDVVASVSGNSLNIWNLQDHEARTENFSIVNQITSIGWQQNESKLIATAAGDNLVCLFDVRQDHMASKFNLNAKTDLVTWSPCDQNCFATSHDREVKIWDVRKVHEGNPIQTLALNSSGTVISKMQFDPIFGKLFMLHDKNMIRLFSVEHGTELDHFKQTNNRSLIAAKFIPLKHASTPGIIALPQRSHNFLYFQIDEGQGRPALVQPKKKSIMGRVKNTLSDNSGSEKYLSGSEPQNSTRQDGSSKGGAGHKSLQLRMAERKSDFAAPKLQMTSPEGIHDYDAFDMRVTVFDEEYPSTDQFQSIAVTSYGEIHLMTLNQAFIESFYARETVVGLASVSENDTNSMKDSEDGDADLGDPAKAKRMKQLEGQGQQQLTPAEQKQKELEILRSLPCVTTVQQVIHKGSMSSMSGARTEDEESKERQQINTVGQGFSLNLKIKVDRKLLGMAIEVPEYYPHAPVQVSFESQYGITGTLFEAIESKVQSKVVQKGRAKYSSMTSVVQMIYSMLGGTQSYAALNEYDFDYDFDNSNEMEESKSAVSPRKAHKTAFEKQRSPATFSGAKKEQQKRLTGFAVYPKTCGFSWNCYGQLAFFANGKYDLAALEKERSLKKLQQVYDKKEKGQQWSKHQEALKSVFSQDSNFRKSDPAFQEIQDNKLVEMTACMSDDKSASDDYHSSTDGDSYSQDSSSQTSSGRENSSNDESSADSEDNEDQIAIQNNVFSDIVSVIEIKKNLAADFNDDDDNILAKNSNVLKLYVHSFNHRVREDPSIARRQPLFDPNVKLFCEQAASAYSEAGEAYQLELAKYWKMVGMALGDMNESKMKIWGVHPLGKGLLMNALRYFQVAGDVQQIAMIAAILFDRERKIYADWKTKYDVAIVSERQKTERAEQYMQAQWAVEEERNRRLFEKDQKFAQMNAQTKMPNGRPPSQSMQKKTLAKNSSQKNLKKPIIVRDMIQAKEISYIPTNMPNSLQESSMEQLSSPTAIANGYNGMMTLSNRNSDKNSHTETDEDEEFGLNTTYDLQLKAPMPTLDTKSESLRLEEVKSGRFLHEQSLSRREALLGHKGYSMNDIGLKNNKKGVHEQPASVQKRNMTFEVSERFQSPNKKSNPNQQSTQQQQSAYHAGRVDSPGSPTVGGLLNTNGERVLLNTGSTRKSLESSFKSFPRTNAAADAYSMYDCRSLAESFHQSAHDLQSMLGSPRQTYSQTKCLQDKLEQAKIEASLKQAGKLDSTSADSGSLFDSSDSEGETEAQQETHSLEVDPSTLSLMLRDDPANARTLLLYLKRYSELLFNWGETMQAVEACKLIDDACKLLLAYHSNQGGEEGDVAAERVMLGTNNNFHFNLQISKRDWLLSDFILFSECSLNYLAPVGLCQSDTASQLGSRIAAGLNSGVKQRSPNTALRRGIMPVKVPVHQQAQNANQDELLSKLQKELNEKVPALRATLQKCSICDMAANGLTFVCVLCGHGGHYAHLTQWVASHRRVVNNEPVSCPTGCGCTACFTDFGNSGHEQGSNATAIATGGVVGQAGVDLALGKAMVSQTSIKSRFHVE